mmetsp:Transcript_32048/g.76469  ORF Transcript_32048/g.76469 Transcript_32048/m.76469 type:complete len:661 (-) Transcript_32048:250-2232(-)|eukprot:CAMPEP_0181429328 /NCGR_PEP_ID=MMETSP1110-20121109/17142_1 /TAXON_ID=174948 /ORGANISM="Symbiodinium sp., Strain CCMP421" /LENGTH=660 /DNA_ID=CAMNT_0023552591 /DNA_START=45 /DNA_END=2027 /DNA_ORIENTATION=+
MANVTGDALELHDAYEAYHLLLTAFSEFHKSSFNVWCHCFCSPLGVLGLCGLLRFLSTWTPGVLAAAYMLSLVPALPANVYVATLGLVLLLLDLAGRLKCGSRAFLAMLALGFFLQDVAHWVSGEATFQSSYSGKNSYVDLENLGAWSQELTRHTYFLLPLCVDVALQRLGAEVGQPLPLEMQRIYGQGALLLLLAIWAAGLYCLDSKNGFAVFPGAPFRVRVLQSNLCSDAKSSEEDRRKDLQVIRDWAVARMPPSGMTSHWWHSDLQGEAFEAFRRCAESRVMARMFRSSFGEGHYCMDIVPGMNEVYISGPSRKDDEYNSDQVFYEKHLDGPYGFLPFASVYRCIVGMDRNLATTTIFPEAGIAKNAMLGDVLAFDFHREVHYIKREEQMLKESDEFRVVLKLHYCVYPRVLFPLGWLLAKLTTSYNVSFRGLFLLTIKPKNLFQRLMGMQVVIGTILFNAFEEHVGQRNLLYLIVSAALWYVTGSYKVFLVMTSYVHYLRYISTFYSRQDVDFGIFKRDVLLFKTLALLQLFGFYFFPGAVSGGAVSMDLDFCSLAMMAVGYSISLLATKALGVDRTYFGSELGKCEPLRVADFPYGYVPHPMIGSQLLALAGMMKCASFRAASPVWLVPIHASLYLVHMMQEHFDIYERSKVKEA